MSRLFICYRRADSAGFARALYDRLSPRFKVFMDVNGTDVSDSWNDVIHDELEAMTVCLVLIGPLWLAENESGRPRLREEDDPVRREIRRALQRWRAVRTIPVLVGGARLPERHHLPDDIQSLLETSQSDLRPASWGRDVGELIKKIGQWDAWWTRAAWQLRALVGFDHDRPGRAILTGILLAAILGLVTNRFGVLSLPPQSPESPSPTPELTLSPSASSVAMLTPSTRAESPEVLTPPTPVGGPAAPSSPVAACVFRGGFEEFVQRVGPSIVGACRENERFNTQSLVAEQETTGGLLMWRSYDAVVSFRTNEVTIVWCSSGMVPRPNDQEARC
jgi:hypothetical protein